MNQPTVAFLERDGRYFKFTDADVRGNTNIQWFAARGRERFPELSMTHLVTLARMWHLEQALGVVYDKAPLHTKQTAEILASLYERSCHPMSTVDS